jgi:hypothetical protein
MDSSPRRVYSLKLETGNNNPRKVRNHKEQTDKLHARDLRSKHWTRARI